MSGAAPSRAGIVGWVVLRHPRLEEGAVTVRWQRGDQVAAVLAGARVGEHGTDRCLAEIPVGARGWVDLAEIRHAAQVWLRHHLGGAR